VSSLGFVTSPRQRTASPGPGNGCRQTIRVRQAELEAQGPHLVFEEVAQRLDQFKLEVVGQATHVVVKLLMVTAFLLLAPPLSMTSG
jgi:hypothetical protein